MPVSDTVVDVVIAEALGEGPEGWAAVGHVIDNRAQSTGRDWDTIVTAGGGSQFNGYSNPGPAVAAAMQDPNIRAEVRAVLEGVQSGQIADQTGGATFYHTPAVSPDWATAPGFQQSTQIGNHIFYTASGGVYPSPPAAPQAPPTPAYPHWITQGLRDANQATYGPPPTPATMTAQTAIARQMGAAPAAPAAGLGYAPTSASRSVSQPLPPTPATMPPDLRSPPLPQPRPDFVRPDGSVGRQTGAGIPVRSVQSVSIGPDGSIRQPVDMAVERYTANYPQRGVAEDVDSFIANRSVPAFLPRDNALADALSASSALSGGWAPPPTAAQRGIDPYYGGAPPPSSAQVPFVANPNYARDMGNAGALMASGWGVPQPAPAPAPAQAIPAYRPDGTPFGWTDPALFIPPRAPGISEVYNPYVPPYPVEMSPGMQDARGPSAPASAGLSLQTARTNAEVPGFMSDPYNAPPPPSFPQSQPVPDMSPPVWPDFSPASPATMSPGMQDARGPSAPATMSPGMAAARGAQAPTVEIPGASGGTRAPASTSGIPGVLEDPNLWYSPPSANAAVKEVKGPPIPTASRAVDDPSTRGLTFGGNSTGGTKVVAGPEKDNYRLVPNATPTPAAPKGPPVSITVKGGMRADPPEKMPKYSELDKFKTLPPAAKPVVKTVAPKPVVKPAPKPPAQPVAQAGLETGYGDAGGGTLIGSSTGTSYNVGQTYSNANGTYIATDNGFVRQEADGSYGSQPVGASDHGRSYNPDTNSWETYNYPDGTPRAAKGGLIVPPGKRGGNATLSRTSAPKAKRS